MPPEDLISLRAPALNLFHNAQVCSTYQTSEPNLHLNEHKTYQATILLQTQLVLLQIQAHPFGNKEELEVDFHKIIKLLISISHPYVNHTIRFYAKRTHPNRQLSIFEVRLLLKETPVIHAYRV